MRFVSSVKPTLHGAAFYSYLLIWGGSRFICGCFFQGYDRLRQCAIEVVLVEFTEHFSSCPAAREVLTVCFMVLYPFIVCFLKKAGTDAIMLPSRRTIFPGGALGNGQTGACYGLAVLVIQGRRNCLDGLTVKPYPGKIRQADFVTTDFQIIGGTFCKLCLDLFLERFLFSLCGFNQLGGLFGLFDRNS